MPTTGPYLTQHLSRQEPADPAPVASGRRGLAGSPAAIPDQPTGRPRTRRPLPVALAAAAVPAYLFPALTTAANALVIPDQQVAARLAVAAWTTIAIPSAAAAALVTLVTYWRSPPVVPGAGASVRAFLRAAIACALVAGAGSAVLIGNGVLGLSVLQFTLTSAAIGGGLSARRWARTNRVVRPGRRR